ncbi:DUF58 domain-containing protein [Paenibacillus xylaniclasticus]|uniref:DUF58 domain-containing protein n=1 Tax=Paenibacillus xylaniclasticus TaxID=588083 RepID=UPI000FDCC32C|nr:MULTISPECIES: DUF58 domain-containing protein [Paenibacillus]GFN32316.1 hypothetical protein PCURB6_25760 [Paenibacillus curdlanolyticus]
MTAYGFIIISVVIIYIQHVIYRRVALRKVTYDRQFDRSVCFEGDEVLMVETIGNEKWFPIPWLRVESLLSSSLLFGADPAANLDISTGQFMQNHKSFFSLMPWRRIRRSHKVTAAKRGVYTLSTVTLTAGDLLGISAQTKQLVFTDRMIVYPIPLLPEDITLPARSWQGELSVQRWVVEDPFRRIGVRPYRPTDSLRLVNWNATARTGELQVHQLDTTADYSVLVVLNVEDHAGVWRDIVDVETIESGIRIAAGIANELIRSGMEVGFGSNGCLEDDKQSLVYVPISGGEPHLYQLYETMALLQIERLMPLHEYLLELVNKLDTATDIIVITTYTDERVYEAAGRLEADGHRVVYQRLWSEREANIS